jgi:cytochrome P450
MGGKAQMYNASIGNGHAARVEMIGFLDKLGIIFDVLLPTVAKGILLRRPAMMALTERFDMDRRAIRRLQKVRDKYGNGPLLLRVLGRKHALILARDDLARVLAEAPSPFTPASDEKTSALTHFEPHVSLISHGLDRTVRRRLNDEALESRCPNHSFAARFAKVAAEEADALLAYAGPTLTWEEFLPAWDRTVRRVVLGDAARDDTHLSDLLRELRGDGNWASLRPRNKRKFESFKRRLERHVARAEPGSLAAALANVPTSGIAAPVSQVAHWIFAFDAGGIATFSTLALLATHADLQARAVREAHDAPQRPPDGVAFPFLRSCLLEALRLWPTTMIVHRKSTEETAWENGIVPAGLSVLIFAPYFHRNDRENPDAHKFAPGIWMDDPGRTKLPFIPFSAGPGICPGRHVVLLTASAMLAAFLRSRTPRLVGYHRLSPEGDLPGTLDHFALEIDIATARESAPSDRPRETLPA